jgi:hypothetical protein
MRFIPTLCTLLRQHERKDHLPLAAQNCESDLFRNRPTGRPQFSAGRQADCKLRGPLSGRVRVRLKPDIRQQFSQAVGRSGRKPPKNIGQVAERGDAMPVATGSHAEKHGRRTATIVAADKKPVFAAHGLSPQRSLREVVVDAQVAIFRIAAQRLPVGQCIRDRLPQWALGQHPQLLLDQPIAEGKGQRGRSSVADYSERQSSAYRGVADRGISA